MAKKIKEEPEAEAVETPESPFEQLEQASMEKLAEVLGQLGESAGAKVLIYRRGPLDSDFAYVTQTPADSFLAGGIEDLKTKYGGGDYRLQLRSRQE